MSLLNRMMSYDKTKNENQESCNCEECFSKAKDNVSVKIKNIIFADDFLTKVENHRLIHSEYEILNTMNLVYWYKDVKTKNFIWKALHIHGDKYDYSKVTYVKNSEKVKIICKIHEGEIYEFYQTPCNHLNNHGCPKCANEHRGDYRKHTKEEFIKQANIIHGIGRYDYSKVVYKNNYTEVCIICKNHDEDYEFYQRPNNHLNGQGCPKCAKEKLAKLFVLTLEEFIERANKVHGEGRYNYSESEYVNLQTPIKIICPKHGAFWQNAGNHLQGHGCLKCSRELQSERQTMTLEEFIEKANYVQGIGTYDYSESEYINSNIPIKIICPKHGVFWQVPSTHLSGEGCYDCGIEKIIKEKTYTLEEFIEKANKKQGIGTYDYSESEYINCMTPIKIICPKHGAFWQRPVQHLQGGGCPICNESQGEKKVRIFLMNNDIEFEREKKFKDCRDKNPLPFDFYLPQYNLCIEFDGKQHFIPYDFNSKESDEKKLENLKRTQYHDQIKNDYCKSHNITLLRFNNIKAVEEELMKYFQEHRIIKEESLFELAS